MIAKVIVDVATKQTNKTYDYLIPEEYESVVEIGHRVKVSFGNRLVFGFVVGITNESETTKLKKISELLEPTPTISRELVDLAKYMSETYFSYYIDTLKTVLPSALRIKYTKYLRVVNKDSLDEKLRSLFDFQDVIKFDSSLNSCLSQIKKAISNGDIKTFISMKDNYVPLYDKYIKVINPNVHQSSKKGKALLDILLESKCDLKENDIINNYSFSKSVINTMIKNKIISRYDIQRFRKIDFLTPIKDKSVVLNEEQQTVYSDISNSTKLLHLIHGVTSSGKTEVYLKLLEDTILNKKQAIMLVPEISLTPQMVSRLKGKFGDDVAVLHSGLNKSERYDEWQKIANEDVDIVVGARSAIFAPFHNLGIIIIDEAHDSSYIQTTSPLYDALDIAKLRSQTHNCKVIFGSATPSVKMYYEAVHGEIVLHKINNRANNSLMPTSKIIDMREELISGNRSMFSRELSKGISKRLEKGEQTILLLNKRGYSSFVMCRECGHVIKCPNCDTTLTYHYNTNSLTCHYCGHSMPNVHKCPNCGSSSIKYVGGGTEKVCEKLHEVFPEARIIRIDSDSTTKKNSLEEKLLEFEKSGDILVGTQMISKGLDFPNVSLVGILNADMTLKLPFYDSFERTYQLIEQVSGRAGRRETNGEVFIQTYDTSNYALKYAATHDYLSFYKEELNRREISDNPPFKKLYQILIYGKIEHETRKISNEICLYLSRNNPSAKILGPTQDFIFILKNNFRYIINLKTDSFEIDKSISYLVDHYKNNKNINLIVRRM